MQKNLLITGASGFIGSYLVEMALLKDYRTIAAIRPNSNKQYLQQPEIEFLEFDFSSDKTVDASLQNFIEKFGTIDYVIHNAGLTRAENNEAFEEVNCNNTIRFVQALQRHNQVPIKFVLVSSLAAYGPSKNNIPIQVRDSKEPLTAYGRSKLHAEQFLYTRSDFPFLIINPTAVYGPRDKDVFFLINTINNGFEVYIGNKNQLLSFVHAADLTAAIFIAMESDLVKQNFLVSDLQVYRSALFNSTIKSILKKKTIAIVLPIKLIRFIAIIAEKIASLTGKVPILNRERLKEFEAPNWGVDASEIQQLGYQPKFDLQNGLADTIEWYKKNNWLK